MGSKTKSGGLYVVSVAMLSCTVGYLGPEHRGDRWYLKLWG